MADRIVQYISGKELMERWGVDLVKLWQIIDNWLQAYSERKRESFYNEYRSKVQLSVDHTPSIPGQIKINENLSLLPQTTTKPPPAFMVCIFD